jgi:hypothetical protein
MGSSAAYVMGFLCGDATHNGGDYSPYGAVDHMLIQIRAELRHREGLPVCHTLQRVFLIVVVVTRLDSEPLDKNNRPREKAYNCHILEVLVHSIIIVNKYISVVSEKSQQSNFGGIAVFYSQCFPMF